MDSTSTDYMFDTNGRLTKEDELMLSEPSKNPKMNVDCRRMVRWLSRCCYYFCRWVVSLGVSERRERERWIMDESFDCVDRKFFWIMLLVVIVAVALCWSKNILWFLTTCPFSCSLFLFPTIFDDSPHNDRKILNPPTTHHWSVPLPRRTWSKLTCPSHSRCRKGKIMGECCAWRDSGLMFGWQLFFLVVTSTTCININDNEVEWWTSGWWFVIKWERPPESSSLTPTSLGNCNSVHL